MLNRSGMTRTLEIESLSFSSPKNFVYQDKMACKWRSHRNCKETANTRQSNSRDNLSIVSNQRRYCAQFHFQNSIYSGSSGSNGFCNGDDNCNGVSAFSITLRPPFGALVLSKAVEGFCPVEQRYITNILSSGIFCRLL